MIMRLSEHPDFEQPYKDLATAARKLAHAALVSGAARPGRRVNWYRGTNLVEGRIDSLDATKPWQVYVIADDNHAGEGEWRMLHEVSVIVV